jgi:hypothetical protein
VGAAMGRRQPFATNVRPAGQLTPPPAPPHGGRYGRRTYTRLAAPVAAAEAPEPSAAVLSLRIAHENTFLSWSRNGMITTVAALGMHSASSTSSPQSREDAEKEDPPFLPVSRPTAALL